MNNKESNFIFQEEKGSKLEFKDYNEKDYFNDPSSLRSSKVLNILTLDCFFNLFSPDQIGQFIESATAKYGVSFSCGEIFLALDKNLENSKTGTDLILNLIIPTKILKSVSENPDFDLISISFFSSSRNNKEGANNLTFSENKQLNFLRE